MHRAGVPSAGHQARRSRRQGVYYRTWSARSDPPKRRPSSAAIEKCRRAMRHPKDGEIIALVPGSDGASRAIGVGDQQPSGPGRPGRVKPPRPSGDWLPSGGCAPFVLDCSREYRGRPDPTPIRLPSRAAGGGCVAYILQTTPADPDSLCWKEIAADRIQRSAAREVLRIERGRREQLMAPSPVGR